MIRALPTYSIDEPRASFMSLFSEGHGLVPL